MLKNYYVDVGDVDAIVEAIGKQKVMIEHAVQCKHNNRVEYILKFNLIFE